MNLLFHNEYETSLLKQEKTNKQTNKQTNKEQNKQNIRMKSIIINTYYNIQQQQAL